MTKKLAKIRKNVFLRSAFFFLKILWLFSCVLEEIVLKAALFTLFCVQSLQVFGERFLLPILDFQKKSDFTQKVEVVSQI